ncbi:MAG: HAD-IIIA family hydrolase [Psychroflexus sp.]|jgi:3-deoxy-D-manno-octulosonate 8-phosphate phosphatase (KDO 8-P phosphatase)|nr:HAD-IIIA family hydrolase [Psychroflexus sp.]MDR9448570.1 HAD-IIIA family hydrolase [Psychroflexus sp.]
MENYKHKLNPIRAFVFDVDGVLTNGQLLITEKGELLRSMNVKDGFALKHALNHDYKICIISGGNNPGVEKRLADLGVQKIFMNVKDKMGCLVEFISAENLEPDQVAFMGDDLPDYHVMQKVGLAVAPQDAVPEIKEIAHYVSHLKGGNACVRDLIKQVCSVQNKWFKP